MSHTPSITLPRECPAHFSAMCVRSSPADDERTNRPTRKILLSNGPRRYPDRRTLCVSLLLRPTTTTGESKCTTVLRATASPDTTAAIRPSRRTTNARSTDGGWEEDLGRSFSFFLSLFNFLLFLSSFFQAFLADSGRELQLDSSGIFFYFFINRMRPN